MDGETTGVNQTKQLMMVALATTDEYPLKTTIKISKVNRNSTPLKLTVNSLQIMIQLADLCHSCRGFCFGRGLLGSRYRYTRAVRVRDVETFDAFYDIQTLLDIRVLV